MPGPYITVAQLLQQVSDILEVPVGNLAPSWVDLVNTSVTKGYVNLIAAIAWKGYSGAQFDSSDQAASWNLQQATYEISIDGKGLGGFPKEDLLGDNIAARIQKGGDMDNFALTVLGQPIAPDGSSPVGGVSSGTISAGPRLIERIRRGWYGGNRPWGC